MAEVPFPGTKSALCRFRQRATLHFIAASVTPGLINTAVVPGTTIPRVRVFLHEHDTLTLPHGHFVGGSGATPFVHLPRYDPNDGEDQIYPGGEALFALWFGSGGEELDVVFFFDGRGRLLRQSVDETWLHMP